MERRKKWSPKRLCNRLVASFKYCLNILNKGWWPSNDWTAGKFAYLFHARKNYTFEKNIRQLNYLSCKWLWELVNNGEISRPELDLKAWEYKETYQNDKELWCGGRWKVLTEVHMVSEELFLSPAQKWIEASTLEMGGGPERLKIVSGLPIVNFEFGNAMFCWYSCWSSHWGRLC